MRGTATSSDTRQNEGPQVFVSQEYKRVSRRAVRCDTMSRLWRPPSPYLLRDVLFGEGLQCEKSIVLRNTTKSESINSQDVPEKWKYWLKRCTWKGKVLTYKMYLKSESINLHEEPEKLKY